MNSIRILITDKCNASCANCLNKTFRTESRFIDLSLFKVIAQYFKDNKVYRIRLMGGEPTIHPKFGEIAKFSQKVFSRVTVFTNGLSQHLLDFSPRENDGINYNGKFAKDINQDLFMPNKPGTRILSIIIDDRLDEKNAIETINHVKIIVPKIKISLTFDCTANIFKLRKSLLKKFDAIYEFCMSNGLETIIDHGLPICFLYNSNVPTYTNFSKCNKECGGLIDANCNLRFCNQVSTEYFSLLEGKTPKPFKLLENRMELTFIQKQETVLKKICLDCPFYGDICNGGCYVQNPAISKDDILQNTELPII